MITYAKKSDIVDTKKTKKIYTKVSEEIINNQIIKYLNKEKSLKIFKDDIIVFNNYFNI